MILCAGCLCEMDYEPYLVRELPLCHNCYFESGQFGDWNEKLEKRD